MNQKPRSILLIGNFLSSSLGTRSVSEDLCLRLLASGWQVIYASRRANRLLRLLDMLWVTWRFRRQYQVAQLDVFSGLAFVWAYLDTVLLKKLNKPLVLTLHGGNLPDFSLRHPGWVRGLLNKADAVTVPSEYLLDAMQPYRNDLTLIPNAVDIRQYAYIPRVTPRAILIWLRAFHKIYNPELAIRVLQKVQEEFPEIRLIMIGPDKEDGSFQNTQKLVSQLGLQDMVVFPGRVAKSQVSEWLNKGDIFINTTNVDNTPISVTEAMACGLCIISTEVGGIPWLLEHETNALLVPPDDPDAMATAVQRILTEPGLAQRLAANARQKAQSFDWAAVLPMWEELFQQMLAEAN